jgi:predicted MFS family arabinose efflux permease
VQPAMTAIVPMLVPRERLMSGIALRTMGQNLAQILGFTFAGITISLVDFGGTFVIQALTYVAAIVAMSLVRLPVGAARATGEPGERPRMLEQVREGLRFVFRDRVLRGIIVLSVVSAIFMIGPTFVLLPEIGRTQLDVSPSWNGLLMGFIGMGMLTTSSFLALKSRIRHKGYWFITNLFLAGIYLIVMGYSTFYPLTAAAVFLWGTSAGVFMNLTQTLVQANTPNQMMGRAMSILMLSVIGIVPLGSLVAGAGAELLGIGGFLLLAGIVIILTSLWAWLAQPALRALD